MGGRLGFAAGFAAAAVGLAVFGAGFFAAGWPIPDGARLAAARFASAGRTTRVFFAALLGAFLGRTALRVVFARLLARLLNARRFFADRGEVLVARRAAARGELRFGRLALLPVGRFLAMAV